MTKTTTYVFRPKSIFEYFSWLQFLLYVRDQPEMFDLALERSGLKERILRED